MASQGHTEVMHAFGIISVLGDTMDTVKSAWWLLMTYFLIWKKDSLIMINFE